MEKIIVCKYDELWLKSKEVKKRMIKLLLSHLKEVIGEAIIKAKREFIIISPEEKLEKIDILQAIPGISTIEMRYSFAFNNLGSIWENVDKWISSKNFNTFGVRVKRKDKNQPFTSKEVEHFIGKKIKEKYKKDVDLKDPDVWVKLEIYKGTCHLIVWEKSGLGGLPYGSEGACEVSVHSYYLIKEVIKRGMYIKNLPKNLKKIYPPRNIEQNFEVIFSPECLEDINYVKKEKGKLILYPFIYLSKKEFMKKEKEAHEFFSKITSL